MEGWSGPSLELEQIEDQYANWIRLEATEWSEAIQAHFPHGKISFIKEVRNITGSGLVESKRLVEIWERAYLNRPVWSLSFVLSLEEKDILSHFGYLESQLRDEKRSKRMLRPEGTKVEGKSFQDCSQDHSLTIEWRVVGEYEIQIANFCPGCGKKLIYF